MTAQIAISASVPTIADWMPERSGMMRDGKFVMKSHDRRGMPSRATSNRIAASPRKASPIDAYMSAAEGQVGHPRAGRGPRQHAGAGPGLHRHLRAGHSYTCR